MTRHKEFTKLFKLSVPFDLIFGLAWRLAVAGVVADQASRRFFVNYEAIQCHKIADNEVKKIMRFMPNARPHIPFHLKPNSYLWI